MTTTSYKAANALVEALQAEHRAASPLAALVLLPLVGQASEIARAVGRLQTVLAADGTRADVGREALESLVSTINATGGLVEHEDGTRAPAGEPDWIDLGDAYSRACDALGVVEVINSADGREAPESREDCTSMDGRHLWITEGRGEGATRCATCGADYNAPGSREP